MWSLTLPCPLLRGSLFTTISLLWEGPNYHILKTLTSSDKLLGHICSMGKEFKVFASQPYWAGHVTWTEKSLKFKHIQFWLFRAVLIFNSHQDTNRNESMTWNLYYYGSYDVKYVYLYIFYRSFPFPCVSSNCLRQIKNGWNISDSYARLGTGTGYARDF